MVRMRLATLLGLLALVPAGAYFLSRGEAIALVLSTVSVLVLLGSVWLMVGDAEGPTTHAES